MNDFPDYYTLLGVSADAPSSAIKATFKKLALQYHPDVYKGADAHERMRLILQAYQTLNDPAARRQYDVQRSEQSYGERGAGARAQQSAARPATAYTGRPRVQTEVSPGARRDRQRHYDFPDFPPGHAVVVDLIDIDYTLSPTDAQTLLKQGLLRGSAPESEGNVYYCHRCHHHWQKPAQPATTLPHACPKCQATDWAEYLLLRCIHCCAVFESEQIRYEIGAYAYGKGASHEPGGLCPPYELFPLCPYCGIAHWSPAEETRVSDLRQRAALRATMYRFVWITVAMLAIVLLGYAVMNGLH
jgi:hypothetical protein